MLMFPEINPPVAEPVPGAELPLGRGSGCFPTSPMLMLLLPF